MRGRLFRPADDEQTEVTVTQTEPVCHLGRTPDGRSVYRWRDRTYVEVKLPSVVEPESSTNQQDEIRALIEESPEVPGVGVSPAGTIRAVWRTRSALPRESRHTKRTERPGARPHQGREKEEAR